MFQESKISKKAWHVTIRKRSQSTQHKVKINNVDQKISRIIAKDMCA